MSETIASVAHVDVAEPTGPPPLRRFWARLPVVLDTGAAGDRPRVDSDATRFRATFQPYDYDALAAGDLTATVASASAPSGRDRAVVTLDAPRRLLDVSTTAPVGGQFRIHRVDGSTFATEPTTTAGLKPGSSRTYSPGASFVDVRIGVDGPDGFALDVVKVRSRPAGIGLAVVPASTPDDEAAAAVAFWRSAAPDPSSVDLTTVFAAAVQAVVDAASDPLPTLFEVSLVVTGDAPFRLVVLDLEVDHVLVDHGFAPLPLVRSDVRDPAALVAALRAPRDEVAGYLRGLLTSGTRTTLDASARPSPALVDRLVADLSSGLATTPLYDPARFASVDLPAELVSVAASGSTGERLVRINRRLLDAVLPEVIRPRTQRRVLDMRDRPTVALRRPPGGPVLEALLTAVTDSAGGRPVVAGESVVGEPAGSEVTIGTWIAAVVRPTPAVSASAVEVLMMGAVAATEVLVEVREDHGGLPAGRALATGTAPVPPGRTGWVRVAFPVPVVVSTTDHWVVLRAAAGRAVWLARPEGAGRWARRGDGDDWAGWVTEGLAAQVRLVTRVRSAAIGADLRLAADGLDLPASEDRDRSVHDLMAALDPHDIAEAAVVMVTARGNGGVTLEPPRLVYKAPS